jgi:hypothetical protein
MSYLGRYQGKSVGRWLGYKSPVGGKKRYEVVPRKQTVRKNNQDQTLQEIFSDKLERLAGVNKNRLLLLLIAMD